MNSPLIKIDRGGSERNDAVPALYVNPNLVTHVVVCLSEQPFCTINFAGGRDHLELRDARQIASFMEEMVGEDWND